jgi:predicted dehydrogenase
VIDRILIIGSGSIGRRHLRLARKLFPSALIAILKHNISSNNANEANHVFYNLDDSLAFSPQIAVIAGPATFHLSDAIRLAKAGIHLLIEKPLSVNKKGVQDLLDICKKMNVVLLVGYNLRFLDSLRKFKSLLDKKIIGNLWSVRCEVGQYLPYWRPESDYKKSVSASQNLGGGVLLELSHEIDYLCWIFGKVNWVQAILSHQSNLEVDVEDTAHLIIGFVSNNSNKQLIASLNLDFIRHDSVRNCVVIGEFGTLRWDGISETIDLWLADKKVWHVLYSKKTIPDESYISEWKNFICSIKNHDKPYVSGEEGLEVLRIIDAARLSSETRRQVALI